MGEIQPPPRCLLFFGLLLSEEIDPKAVHGWLEAEFGKRLSVSDLQPFEQTTYYEAEMGPNLRRQFLAVDGDFDPGRLAAVKRRTNEIEQELAENGRRRVNVDPGCLSRAKVVLATTKDQAHRVYIGDGVFAEVTLAHHRGKGFEPWPWTYPDYREAWVREWFEGLRGELRGSRG